MAWLTENWIWVLFGGAFIAMHLFGHGGHGGHGSRGKGNGHAGHGLGSGGDTDTDNAAAKQGKKTPPAATGDGRETHRH